MDSRMPLSLVPKARRADPEGSGPPFGLIVHSHLRWDFVWQRPQQLLSRFARRHPVFFVEEPVVDEEATVPRLDVTTPHDSVLRSVPRLPRALAGDYDSAARVVRSLVRARLAASDLRAPFERRVQWFYTAMPAPLMLGEFGEAAVVYDCMDELAQFKFAPSDIARRERVLLSEAAVVFTGGHRLYESKSRFHANVHFFGCGVDVGHFGRARAADTQVPEDVATARKPILGFFGVIDERIDYDLIRKLAVARPDATLVMIGPTAKVDPAELPQAPNLRWLGRREYADLPRYLKAFDVCLMPFALNEATEFINPTKTLEYMASGRPIVSTAVADVVRSFSEVVRVASSPDEFVAAVRDALESPDESRIRRGLALAEASTWDSIVVSMERLIDAALLARTAGRRATPAPAARRSRATGGGVRRETVRADLATDAGTGTS
jgi:glycosyltransferase involved in cell wall biosynthesis